MGLGEDKEEDRHKTLTEVKVCALCEISRGRRKEKEEDRRRID